MLDTVRYDIAKFVYPKLFKSYDRLGVQLVDLVDKVGIVCQPAMYEDIYNNKYPKSDIVYEGRPVPKVDSPIAIDVRDFFTLKDSAVRKVVDSLCIYDKTDDEKALACLIWVMQNIDYRKDETNGDFWKFSFETLYYRHGDCEDGANLLANMIVLAGVPYWKVRSTAGNVDDHKGNVGGHCFVTYFCEEIVDWKLLDWCYYPNKVPIKDRSSYKNETYYLDTWFSWNAKYAFSKIDVRSNLLLVK